MKDRIYKTFENVSAHDKALVQQIIMRLEDLTNKSEEIMLERIDAADFPKEDREIAKNALRKQYGIFRAILGTVVIVDEAPQNELPS